MTSIATKQPHLERTAAEPRDNTLHTLTLNRVEQINPRVRLFRLELPTGVSSVQFQPGQWVDTYPPSYTKPGGFTITSSPSKARAISGGRVSGTESSRYIELAIQTSPPDTPAAWFWGPPSSILGQEVRVRVGGSFVWPPSFPGGVGATTPTTLKRVVFVAGGVGINPLISMASYIAESGSSGEQQPFDVHVLYSVRDADARGPSLQEEGDDDDGSDDLRADRIPFLERLATMFAREKFRGSLKLFLTGGTRRPGESFVACNEMEVAFQARRITMDDVREALGERENRTASVVYLCGLPGMIDDFVEQLTSGDEAIDSARIRCEKWW